MVCNLDGQLPYCLNGQCACTKSAGLFERGDGTTQGSCNSPSDKCHFNGQCGECELSSHCYGLTDTCSGGRCMCGSSGPCNPLKSNSCTNGNCYCGTEIGGCHTADKYYSDQVDPRTNAMGLQRTGEEICELITEYYNPKYISNHPLMKNGVDDKMNPTYATEYNDDKGSHVGTYQCLGSFIELNYIYIYIYNTFCY